MGAEELGHASRALTRHAFPEERRLVRIVAGANQITQADLVRLGLVQSAVGNFSEFANFSASFTVFDTNAILSFSPMEVP